MLDVVGRVPPASRHWSSARRDGSSEPFVFSGRGCLSVPRRPSPNSELFVRTINDELDFVSPGSSFLYGKYAVLPTQYARNA